MTYELKPCPKPEPKAKPARTPRKRPRVKAKNARRGGHMFPKNVDEPYREWIRGLPCILAGRMTQESNTARHACYARTEVCHVKTRGSGGKDRNNVYPGCSVAHFEQHALGIPAFELRWGVSLKAIARQLTEIYEAEKFPCP